MTSTNVPHRTLCVLFALASAFPAEVFSQETEYEFGGHVKGRLLGQSFPDNSAFNSLVGSSSLDIESDLRLNFEAKKGRWSFDVRLPAMFAGYGDRINPAGLLPGAFGKQPTQ